MKVFKKLFGTFSAMLVMVGTSSLLHAVPKFDPAPAEYRNCATGEKSSQPFPASSDEHTPFSASTEDKSDQKETPEKVVATPDFAAMSLDEIKNYLVETQRKIVSGESQMTSALHAELQQAAIQTQKKLSLLSEKEQEKFKQELTEQAQQGMQEAEQVKDPGADNSIISGIYYSFLGAASLKLIYEPVFSALGKYVFYPVTNALSPAATYMKNTIFGAPTAEQLATQAQAEAQRAAAATAATQAHREYMNNIGEKIGTNKLFGYRYLSFLKEKSPEILQLGATFATFTTLYSLAKKASKVTGVDKVVSNWYYGAKHKKEIKKYNKNMYKYKMYCKFKHQLKEQGMEQEIRKLKKVNEPELSLGAHFKIGGATMAQTLAVVSCGLVSNALVGSAFNYMFAK